MISTAQPDILISTDDARALGLALDRFDDDAAMALGTAEQFPRDVAALNCTVTYSQEPGGARRTVILVLPGESDAGTGRISVLASIGRALLGRAVGATVDTTLPAGQRVALRIEAVRDAART